MKKINYKQIAQRGFSLLELLVTIIIGAFITLAAVTFMHNTAMSYHTQDMTARLQENARFAVQMMSYDFRQAGYYGCSGTAPDTTVPSVEGVDGDGAESDELTIRFSKATGGAVDIAGDIEAGAESFKLVTAGTADPATAKEFFGAGQQLIISDCIKSEIATVKTAGAGDPSEITLEAPLEKDYNMTTTVRAFSDAQYIIKARDDDGVPALFRVQGSEEQPLVDGVDYMRVLFGIDTDADRQPNEYRPAGALADGEDIVSIRVGMLIRSISNKTRDEDNEGEFGLETDERKYDVLDQQDIEPDERRVTRRVFTTTMMLRNQS